MHKFHGALNNCSLHYYNTQQGNDPVDMWQLDQECHNTWHKLYTRTGI